jgi:hypothetical protein
MGKREILAVLGLATITASTSIYVLSGGPIPLAGTEFQQGSGEFAASSRVTNVPAPGRDGPATITRTIVEEWSWKVPTRIVAGQSATVSVQCRIKEETTLRSGPVDAQVEKTTMSIPDSIPEPRTLTIEGTFWKEPATQTTAAGHQNPLEWSWVVTAHESTSHALIQIALPAQVSVSGIGTRRVFSDKEPLANADSRFATFPVEVVGGGTLWENSRANVVPFIGWLLGGGLLGPWVSALPEKIGAYLRKRKERRIIVAGQDER